MLYWLRRIPAETRIVALVVFLALFQAILLSVFGLGAIRRERERVARTLHDRAEDFLESDVAVRCRTRLDRRADNAGRAAFDTDDPDWTRQGGSLFTDAFLIRADGRIEDAAGLPLWLPRELVEAEQRQMRRESEALRGKNRGHEFGDAEKAARNLAFALKFPFLFDDLGGSLSLLHAATPLVLSAESVPDAPALRSMRWVGVLNRLAGYVPDAEVAGYLGRIDAAGGGTAAFRRVRDAQEARARVLAALVKERPAFPTGLARWLHRNVHAGREFLFYLRPWGSRGETQVLAVDRGQLESFLRDFAQEAQARAPAGVRLSFEPESARRASPVRVSVLPGAGYVATAQISEETILAQAAASERFYWYIIGFSVAGILAGGLLTARVVVREMKLAKLKAGFVSNVSHALKTPLTSISMFSEMLRNGQVTEEAERKECLEVITQETARLGRLIQQVLDFGRLEARRLPFHWTTGPLEAVVAKEAKRFRRTTGLSGRHFRVRLAINLPPVTHDPEAFGEVVANLLSNAFKYTVPAKRRIDLTLGPQRGRVVLSVEDNGPGIPAREKRKIFEQFYRSDDLLTRDVEGTGLGLSIARNIVRAHGGRIFVEDGSAGGSRFVVVLPAAPKEGAKKARAPEEASR